MPQDVALIGIDDVRYASLLPVPLTTVHQPCQQIGEAAVGAMLDRISQPSMPPRSIQLEGTLVVRASCRAEAPYPGLPARAHWPHLVAGGCGCKKNRRRKHVVGAGCG